MSKRVGVILGGSGHRDGSEIHESVLTMLSLENAGAEIVCLSLNQEQYQVVNHLTGERENQKRNLMTEAARIARGQIQDLRNIKPNDLDAIVFPGGFGCAFNWCDFAEKKSEMRVVPEITQLITSFHESKKPIGAICISPVIVAKVLGKEKIKLTIGNDRETASILENWGVQHTSCCVDETCVDEKNKIVSTPAYMLGEKISDIYPGINKLAYDLIALI